LILLPSLERRINRFYMIRDTFALSVVWIDKFWIEMAIDKDLKDI